MKKKLIQILMLLVVAVSMGAFVSCKDTNDDLRNEFAQALGQSTGNKTVWEMLEQQEADLATLRQKYADALAAIEAAKCHCGEPGGLKDQLTILQTTVTNLNNLINGGGSSSGGSGIIDIIDDYIDEVIQTGSGGSLQDIINQVIDQGGDIADILQQIETITNNLNSQGANITFLLSNAETAAAKLDSTINELDNLKEKVDAIKSCECNISELWDAINLLQTGLATAQQTAQNALDLATTANNTANTAKLTADEAKTAAAAATENANAATALATQASQIATNAQTIATQAGLDAQDAKTFAEAAKQTAESALNLANQAISDAATAQALAGANKEAIDALKQDIQTIQTTLTQYGTQISDNTAAIQKNAQDIAENVSKIQANSEAIQKNKEDIAAIQTQITTLSTDVAQALQDAAAANALATTNAAAIENIKNDVSANKTAIDSLKLVTKELESNVTELTTKLNDLTTQVNNNTTNITNLTNRIEEVNTNLTNSINNITSTVTELQTTVADHEQKLTDMATELAAAKAECAANLVLAQQYAEQQAEAVKTALETKINELIAQLANYYTKDQVYTKEEVDNLLKDLKDELNVTISNNTARIEVLEGKITVLDEHGERITALETKLDGYETLVETVNGHTTAIQQNADAIAAINEALAEIKSCTCDPEVINGILERLTTAEGNITSNTELINTVKEELTNLINQQIDDLKSELEDEIEAVDDKVDALQVAFDNLNYITPEEVDNKLNTLSESLIELINAEKLAREQGDENLQNQIDEIKQSVVDAVARIAANEAAIAALEASKVNVSDYEADKADILDKIDANTTKIGDLQDAVDAISDDLDALKDDVEDLKTRMDNAEANIKNAMDDIQELKSDVAAIQDYLAKQVTSIMVQGTYNPWYGTFSLPVDVQSNVLIAFYGKPTSDVVFPTSRTANYVRAQEALTEKDMEMLGLSEEDPLFDHTANVPLMYDNGYAGKIYMTINPNTADVSGLQPVIVNSLDEESYITLTPIQPSGARLQFGFTRAGQSSNGFYEADAVVTPANVQKINSPKLETGAMADAAAAARDAIEAIAKEKSLTGTGAGVKLEQIANDVSKIVRGLRFDRSALKCSYTTQEADGSETEHAVYSQYNLAATAFVPLSLETAKDFHYATIPGFERANNLLDRIANKVNGEIHTFFKELNGNGITEKLKNLEIKKIVVKDLDENLLAKFDIEISEDFVIDGLSYHLVMPISENVTVKFDRNLTIPIDIEGLTVSVPVDIDEDVSVDLSGVSITAPTVVVTGTATGTAGTAEPAIDPETGLPMTDGEGNYLYSVLVVPVEDTDGNIVGYTYIPLDDIVVGADITASGTVNGGQPITLDGTPVGHVTIHKTVEGEVDIHDNIQYHLEIEETVPVEFNIDKWFYFGDNGTDTKTFHFEKKISMRDAVEDLWGNAQEAIGSVNTMLDQLRDLVDAVNDALDKINSYEEKLTNTVNDYVDKIKSYIDKINSTVVNAINNTNQLFQPFMVASTDKGTKRLSGSKSYPTVLTSDVTLFATTQTMELFVPIAKKHVAVTNVFKGTASAQDGDADCLARLQAANTGRFNTVQDGTERFIQMRGMQSGYVYEIAYSCLDFHGKIATRKYYVTVQ